MRCLVKVKSSRLDLEEKGAFFAFRRYGEPLIFGVLLSEPDEKNAEVKVLLLNPNFQESETKIYHRIYAWQGNQECLSFGKDWVILPNLDEKSVSEYGNPPKEKFLSFTKDGLHFCAVHGENGFPPYPYQVNVETLEFSTYSSSQMFYLRGYSIFLSVDDYKDGRKPIFEHK